MNNVLILEDHTEVRVWLSSLVQKSFEGTNITQTSTVAQAMQALRGETFDLALIDYQLPDGLGVDVIREILKHSPQTYCVIATIFDDDKRILEALKAGAKGYLLKEQSELKLIASLQGILRGDPPLSPVVARKLIRHFQIPPEPEKVGYETLSTREIEILTLVAKGLNRGEIAEKLLISSHTVSSHIRNIYGKLDVNSKAKATVKAVQLGLIDY